MFGITGISGLSNPLGSEGLASSKLDDDDDSCEGAPMKKAGGTNGTHTEGGIVKANKGMILRKSVEYIKYASLRSRMAFLVGKLTAAISTLRYLQQLVSAQASRNRDLEQDIQAYHHNGAAKLPDGTDMIGKTQNHFEVTDYDADGFSDLVLHEDIDPDLAIQLNGHSNFGLGPMPEEDTAMDTGRRVPSGGRNDSFESRNTSRMDTSLTPPSIGTGSVEDDDRPDSSVELNRGRDRTVRQNGMGEIQVKNEVDDMQT